jgi:hypothetical protein
LVEGVNSRIVQEVMFPDALVEIEKKSAQLFAFVALMLPSVKIKVSGVTSN